jgi:hypothetical protein
MAKNKQSIRKPAAAKQSPISEQEQTQEQQAEKGYAGSSDYATGQVQSSAPDQASNERLREDRVRQRNSDVVTGEDDE